MAKSKNLGMGLDLLLTAGEFREKASQEPGRISHAQQTMGQALKEDEAGNFCEAYYLYRKLIDFITAVSGDKKTELSALLSQAYNNAAIILFEQGDLIHARDFLHKSLMIQPDNSIAKENLEQLINS